MSKPNTTKTAQPMQNYAKENEAMQKLEAMVEELEEYIDLYHENNGSSTVQIQVAKSKWITNIEILLDRLLRITQDWKRMREDMEEISRREWLPLGNDEKDNYKWINHFKDIAKNSLHQSNQTLADLFLTQESDGTQE